MDVSRATPELFAALSDAQGEIENASKNSSNPHFKSKYADLAEVLNTIRPVFSKHGLSIIQSPSFDGSMASVYTLLAHKSGGYILSKSSAVPAKTDGQGIGSVTTYLRRYSAAAAGGIAQEDDDGQSSRHEGKPAPIATGRPMDGVWEAMDTEQQAFLTSLADKVKEYFGTVPDAVGALDYIKGQNLDNDETTALWTLLESGHRSALKRAKEAQKATSAQA